jgi:hypothetical protein
VMAEEKEDECRKRDSQKTHQAMVTIKRHIGCTACPARSLFPLPAPPRRHPRARCPVPRG